MSIDLIMRIKEKYLIMNKYKKLFYITGIVNIEYFYFLS